VSQKRLGTSALRTNKKGQALEIIIDVFKYVLFSENNILNTDFFQN
jgi:hypothetical protein